MFFGQKRKLFPHKVIFLLSQHLVHLIWRLDFDVEHHLSHTVKFRSLLVQTWKPMKPIFLTFFGPKRKLFSHKFIFFIVTTLCASDLAATLGLWDSSESYSKIPERFSADLKTPKYQFFWRSSAQNVIFFLIKLPFFIAHLVHLKRRLSSNFEHHQHCAGEMRSILVQTWKPQKLFFNNSLAQKVIVSH